MKKKRKPLAPAARARHRFIEKALTQKLSPVLNAISAYQASLQQNMLLLRNIKGNQIVQLKQLNVLLIIPTMTTGNAPNEVMFEEQLKHLVKDVVVIKYAYNISESLTLRDFDLLLVLSGEEPLPAAFITALKLSPVKKAVWFSDNKGVTDAERQLAPLFDYIFTQRTAHITTYQGMQCKKTHYLPFPANPSVFYPKSVDTHYHSDVLIIGDAYPSSLLEAFIRTDLLSSKKVCAYGEGWESFEAIETIQSDLEIENYYNGAKMVINCRPFMQRMLEVSACGVFQLIQAHEDVSPYEASGDSPLSFSTIEELTRKFEHYWSNVDARRLAATRALADSKYNHSFLQKGMQLLNAVFD